MTSSVARRGGPAQCHFCPHWSITPEEWQQHHRECWVGWLASDDEPEERSAVRVPAKPRAAELSVLPLPVPLKKAVDKRKAKIERLRKKQLKLIRVASASLFDTLCQKLWLSPQAYGRLAFALRCFNLETVADLVALSDKSYAHLLDKIPSANMRARIWKIRNSKV